MKLLLTSLFSLYFLSAVAQNLEKVGDKNAIKVNGGINYSSIFYTAEGLTARRDPFNWFLSGNVTLSLWDCSLPFSYSYSNQHGAFTQPFNQFGATPQYKWIKGYLGFNSMTFSSYTLAGHVFLGVGAELTPGNWKVSLMYGRLKKAVPYDVLENSDRNMAYQRMGYGTKIGYEKNGTGLHLALFKASDEPSSIAYVPENTQIVPQDNTVASIIGKARISKRITAEAEYALSGLTRNTFSESNPVQQPNYLPGVYKLKSSSQFYQAFKTVLGYRGNNYGVQFNYERISPDYKTLGAYYFNNDVENITIAPSFNLLEGKLNLSFNTGYQHNNLDKSKLNTTTRWVGSANAAFNPNEHWAFTLSYSNFNSFTKMRSQEDPFFKNTLDTLNFYQLSQDANAAVNYSFGTDKLKHTLMLNGTYQLSGEKSGTRERPIPTTVYSCLAGYAMALIPIKTTATFSFNLNKSELNALGMATLNTTYWGPSVSIGKAFFKNTLRSNLGITYNNVIANGITNNSILNNRFSLNYAPKLKNEKVGKPTLGISCSYLQRFKTAQQPATIKEFTANLNLSYSF